MLAHISINLFPIIMLLIIYANNHNKTSKTDDKKRFDILILLALGLIFAGILNHGLAHVPGVGIRVILWLSYTVYNFLVIYVSAVWFFYVSDRLRSDISEKTRRVFYGFLRGIVLLLSLLIVTNPWTKFLFVITINNEYQVGKLNYLPYIGALLLLALSMHLSLHSCRYSESAQRRSDGRYLLTCGIPPVAGLVMQYFFSERWVGAPCLSLTILFVYLNTQNRQITTDELTGLNNRGEFDQQIARRAEQIYGGNWGMLMLDINNFKQINDTLGHAIGDEAIWETADILRQTLGKGKVLLARYGGDEFAVIGDWRDEEEALQKISEVEDGVNKFNKFSGKEYQLSFSMGYAMWNEVRTVEELVKKADERMYLIKEGKKKERTSQA